MLVRAARLWRKTLSIRGIPIRHKSPRILRNSIHTRNESLRLPEFAGNIKGNPAFIVGYSQDL